MVNKLFEQVFVTSLEKKSLFEDIAIYSLGYRTLSQPRTDKFRRILEHFAANGIKIIADIEAMRFLWTQKHSWQNRIVLYMEGASTVWKNAEKLLPSTYARKCSLRLGVVICTIKIMGSFF